VSEQRLERVPDPRPGQIWQIALAILAVAAVVATGVVLGRVLLSQDWTLAVTVVGLGALLLALLLDPVAGLLLCVVLAPFGQFIHLTLQFGRGIPALDVTRLTALFLFAQLAVQAIGQPRSGAGDNHRRLPALIWLDVAMLLFVGAMLLSVPVSSLGLVDGAQTVISFIALPLLFYYFARTWSRTPRTLIALIGALALVGALMGIITAREQLTGITTFSPVAYSVIYEGKIRKVLSLFRSPATMASTLAVMVPLLLYGVQQASTWGKRLIVGAALVCVLAGVFLAYVRGGWLAALLGIAVLILLNPRMRRALIPLIPLILIATLLLSGISLVNPETVESRLTSEEPIAYRLRALEIALAMVRESPLLGVGFDNFGTQAIRQYGWDPHAGIGTTMPSTHNSFVYVLVSGGLLAFLPFLAIFIGLARRGFTFWRLPTDAERRRSNRELAAVLWATLAAYVAAIATFDVFNAQYTNLIFFVIMGTLLGNLEQANGEVVG
jgi:hypothetical protein